MATPLSYVDFPVRIRTAEVIRTTRLSASMIRLTVGGAGATGFESAIPDEHIKLIFADPDTGELRLPTPDGDELNWPRPIPTSREYTIRQYRPETNEIDIDFVVHASGLASDWVVATQAGDPVYIAGPPGGYKVADDYGQYLIVGDETALPAIARWLEEMPRSHKGWVYIEVPDASSEQPLTAPSGVTVTWVHTHGSTESLLEHAVKAGGIVNGESLFVWLAGEAGTIKPLRRWIRNELGITKQHSSITGYWKRGLADTHEHLDDDESDGDESEGDSEE